MFSFKEAVEKSVHSTGVPLSERFKHVPSHNPLRPSQEVKRIVRGFPTASTTTSNARIQRNPGIGHRERFPGVGGSVNKLAVVKATKDAEILRLRARLRSMEDQLQRLDSGHGRSNPLKKIIGRLPMKNRSGNFMFKRRGGGGFVVAPKGGKHLNLQSASALSVLGIEKVRRNPRSPLKGSGPVRGGQRVGKNLNFFGSPKSKDDLDKELDSYMSQAKSKQKTDLDKELDEYMKVARSQSFAGKVGLVGLTPTTPPLEVDSDEGQMEIS